MLNTLPPHPLAAPEGGGGHPQSAHTVPEIKASHCCGDGGAEQGGSDGYGRRGRVCLAAGKEDTERRVREKGWGEGELAAKRGNRDGVKEKGSQALSNHFGTLGRRGCPGVPRAWGAPCRSQTPASPEWCGERLSSCPPVLPPLCPATQSCSPLKCPKCLDFF